MRGIDQDKVEVFQLVDWKTIIKKTERPRKGLFTREELGCQFIRHNERRTINEN